MWMTLTPFSTLHKNATLATSFPSGCSAHSAQSGEGGPQLTALPESGVRGRPFLAGAAETVRPRVRCT